MDRSQLVELFPELAVLDGFLSGRFPIITLPVVHPLVEALEDVLAVGIDIDPAGLLDRREPLDDGGELHAIVGGLLRAATALDLLAGVRMAEDEGPASGSGVARTGAVGKQQEMMLFR